MKTYSADLKKSRRWLASGRASKTIRYLEPKVPLFLEDPEYYAILGRACLESGLLRDADTYLNRGLQADPAHVELRLILAVNYLRRKDPASAVRLWLEVLEEQPRCVQAKKGLEALRKISDQMEQDHFLNEVPLSKYLPKLRSIWPLWTLLLASLLLVGLGIYGLRSPVMDWTQSMFSQNAVRPGAEQLAAEMGNALTQEVSGEPSMLTEREVRSSLKEALKAFEEYDDNRARRELNRILLSNLTPSVQAAAMDLRDRLSPATIETLKSQYSFGDVASNPSLYEGCQVLWKGVTANVRYEGDAIRFDFLVGFDEGKILEGRVLVEVPFAAVMEPLPLELLAQVIPDEQGKFSLEANTLHFLR
ncbi:MAG: hypothetical protein MI717_15065 [Spirochaetales bacterium]|nr:hypothetical protein [Spirochaetales bacterium]